MYIIIEPTRMSLVITKAKAIPSQKSVQAASCNYFDELKRNAQIPEN